MDGLQVSMEGSHFSATPGILPQGDPGPVKDQSVECCFAVHVRAVWIGASSQEEPDDLRPAMHGGQLRQRRGGDRQAVLTAEGIRTLAVVFLYKRVAT